MALVGADAALPPLCPAHPADMNPAEESDGRAGPPTGLVWDPYNAQVVPAAAVLATSSQNVTVPFTTDTNPRCQVAGCTSSLGSMARYDVRYKVCSTHRRAEAVTHEGALQRFCQQHGVFHPLEAFEGTQRSCREGLARHNSKRRESRKGRAVSSHGGSRRQGRRRRSSATRPSSEESEELLSSGTDLPRRESLRQQQRRARQETSDSGAYLAGRQSSGLSPVEGGAGEPASFCSDELLDQGLPWDELEAPPGLPLPALELGDASAGPALAGQVAPSLGLSAPTALLTRASFKLYETGPEELPRDIRSSLEHMIPAHVLEGFVRMGCVHVTLDCLVDCGATGSPPSGQSLLRGLADLAARPGWAAVPAMHVQVGGLLARAGRGVPDPVVRDLAGEGAPRVEAARRALPLPASRAVELRLTLHACDLRRDRLLLRSQGVYLEHKLLSVTHDGGGGAWHLVVEARLPSPIKAACIRCEVLAGDTLSEPLYLLVSADEGLVKSLHEVSRANPSPTALDGLLFALGLAGGRLRSRCTVRLSHPLTLERVAACCGPHDAAQLLQLAADGPEARRRLSKEHPELGAAVDVDCHAPRSSLASRDACLAFVEPALEARFGTWFAERQGGTDTLLLGLSMLSWVLGLLHSRHSTQGTAVLLGLSLVHAAVLVVRF
ncbi:Squamosa promoter-binding-like protein 8 [Auxenochlorella protothecoides]|uniref:Squamosa promoter-binding-like protein 8 n=1 Tax=Auxenochlorella protothecoides TaxID=3075 RepID=A0A087SIF1_AUXPR|nr:Squamosa promoter-binding-like protein 8 [Auxenochlorella protothecoides]KFM25505.1 Squamosa promoter-binding-like protein 8 [Auxenochlorella protothecoides]